MDWLRREMPSSLLPESISAEYLKGKLRRRRDSVTKKELSQLYYLNHEIEQERRRLRELEAAATSVSPKITGLPHINKISDKTAIAAQIADCRAVIEAKLKLSVVEYNRLNRFIASVDDSRMRQILSLRYINGFSWQKIAFAIGGGNSADSARKLAERYINRKL